MIPVTPSIPTISPRIPNYTEITWAMLSIPKVGEESKETKEE